MKKKYRGFDVYDDVAFKGPTTIYGKNRAEVMKSVDSWVEYHVLGKRPHANTESQPFSR